MFASWRGMEGKDCATNFEFKLGISYLQCLNTVNAPLTMQCRYLGVTEFDSIIATGEWRFIATDKLDQNTKDTNN